MELAEVHVARDFQRNQCRSQGCRAAATARPATNFLSKAACSWGHIRQREMRTADFPSASKLELPERRIRLGQLGYERAQRRRTDPLAAEAARWYRMDFGSGSLCPCTKWERAR